MAQKRVCCLPLVKPDQARVLVLHLGNVTENVLLGDDPQQSPAREQSVFMHERVRTVHEMTAV